VLRRALVVLGGSLAAALFVSPALAAKVEVRIEGARGTIWGKTEPRVSPVTGTFSPPDGPNVTVSGPTPFGALERASRIGEIYYRVQDTSFGPYVDRIGRRSAGSTTGWVFKVNHVSPPVGADSVRLKRGDNVLWYWATFGPAGGPKTLDLVRRGSHCFRAFAYADNGSRSKPGRVLYVGNGGRRTVSETGRFCAPEGWRTVRAKKAGHVRSDLLWR
jgi:Domain of unknown function (DUF4430)